jgi:hypothetical protein
MALAGTLLLAAIPAGFAQTLTTLATFSGANGQSPSAPLILGFDGNFYGTTQSGAQAALARSFK